MTIYYLCSLGVILYLHTDPIGISRTRFIIMMVVLAKLFSFLVSGNVEVPVQTIIIQEAITLMLVLILFKYHKSKLLCLIILSSLLYNITYKFSIGTQLVQYLYEYYTEMNILLFEGILIVCLVDLNPIERIKAKFNRRYST